MKLAPLVVLAACLLPVGVLAEEVRGVEPHLIKPNVAEVAWWPTDAVLPQVVDGAGWKTTIILVNLSANPASFDLFFTDDNNNPLYLPWIGIGTYSSLSGTLAVGGSATVETTGTASQLAGGAGNLITRTGRIGGQAIFRRLLPGLVEAEAVVPFSSGILRRSILPLNQAGGFRTGVALTNNSPAAITITLTARDERRFIIATNSATLPTFAHRAFMFDDPLLNGQRGTVEFRSSGDFSILGLRGAPSGTLTTLLPLEENPLLP